jgi:hypothetical protein
MSLRRSGLAAVFEGAALNELLSDGGQLVRQDARMSTRAAGTFDVTTNLEPRYDGFEDGTVLGRVSLSKTFHGDLEATSEVVMLTAGTPVKGSAGYVAIERVVGKLAGRSGAFILQHSGAMNRGAASLTVTVVADSGTGELAGLSGAMTIDIVDGKHYYGLDYTLG